MKMSPDDRNVLNYCEKVLDQLRTEITFRSVFGRPNKSDVVLSDMTTEEIEQDIAHYEAKLEEIVSRYEN